MIIATTLLTLLKFLGLNIRIENELFLSDANIYHIDLRGKSGKMAENLRVCICVY